MITQTLDEVKAIVEAVKTDGYFNRPEYEVAGVLEALISDVEAVLSDLSAAHDLYHETLAEKVSLRAENEGLEDESNHLRGILALFASAYHAGLPDDRPLAVAKSFPDMWTVDWQGLICDNVGSSLTNGALKLAWQAMNGDLEVLSDERLILPPFREEKVIVQLSVAPGSYKNARGVFDWQPGDEPAEVSVRRLRDGDHITDAGGMVASNLQHIRAAGIVCEDCGMSYADFGMDTTLPHDQWYKISTNNDENGILCANCMVKRGREKFPDALAARMKFAFASDYRDDELEGFSFTRPTPSAPVKFWSPAEREAMERAL